MFQSLFSVVFIGLQLHVVLSLFVSVSLCCVGRTTLCNSAVLAHVTDKTATGVLAQGSSLSV